MTSPRIAAFGCGYWGRNHIRTLAGLGVLAAVTDKHADVAGAMAVEHGAMAMTPEAIFADQSIDAVVLALPASAHAAMAMRALDAGKHVLVEKPISLAPEDADAMVAKARGVGRILMAGHILRYHNTFKALIAEIDGGRAGDIVHIQSHRLAFGKFHATFDALWDLAPHDLSLVLSVFGGEPADVSVVRHAFASDQADSGHIHMRFDGGRSADVHVSRHSAYNERRFVAKGTKGSLIWDDWADWPEKLTFVPHSASKPGEKWQFERGEPHAIATEPGMALTDELQHFIDCIANGAQPLTDGAQGAAVVRILSTG